MRRARAGDVMRDPNDLPLPDADQNPASGVRAQPAIPSDLLSQFQGKQAGGNSRLMLGLSAGVAAAVVIGFRVLTAAPDPGTAVIVTQPAQVEVSLDNGDLKAQTSPIKLEGLTPDVDHTVDISKEGFKSQSLRIRLSEGELKTLPPVALEAVIVETGFSLNSNPAGATVLLDGQKLAAVTPVRLTDVTPGKHVIRVENGLTHEAWQGEIDAVAGKVIELPAVTLVALSPREVKKAERAAKLQAKRDAKAAAKAARAAARAQQ
jgi:hypothetical protein